MFGCLLNNRPASDQPSGCGGGIEGIDGVVEIDPQRFVAIQFTSGADQPLREIAEEPPVAVFVRVRQRSARDSAAQTHVVELRLLSPQTGFYYREDFRDRSVVQRPDRKLIQAGKTLDLVVALIAVHTTAKFWKRKKVHKLRKNRSSGIHLAIPFTKLEWPQRTGNASKSILLIFARKLMSK